MATGIGLELKRLRESAVPPLSIRVLAEKVGLIPSSYAYYEDSFKGKHLPVTLIDKLVPVLMAHGIPRESVLKLGGVHMVAPQDGEIDADLLTACIEAVDQVSDENGLNMPPHHKAEVAAKIYQVEAKRPSGDVLNQALRMIVQRLARSQAPE